MDDTDKVIESQKNDVFMNNLSSTLSVKRNFELHEYDYKWLEIIEDTLPYIDNILRNPKRFIINEEEIVKVELARKVTVESVIHLTQHTNLIQDIDKNGDVKPSKILNINKEESLDTYENKFIYTLLNNLRLFFEQRSSEVGACSSFHDKKNIVYKGNTSVGTEKIEFQMEFRSIDNDTSVANMGNTTLSYEDRLKKIKVQLDGFFCTELMQTLSKLHVSPVRSPIKKTNVILKNPNFQKAEQLWNFIQSYENTDRNVNEKNDYFDTGILKNEYDQAVLMAYIANKSLNETETSLTEEKMLTDVIDRLIDNLLDSDSSITEDQLKELFIQEIKRVKNDNNHKKRVIISNFKDKFERELKNINSDYKLLEEGV